MALLLLALSFAIPAYYKYPKARIVPAATSSCLFTLCCGKFRCIAVFMQVLTRTLLSRS